MQMLTLVLILTLAACSSKSAEDKQVTKEGVNVKNNPLGAISAIGNMASDMEKLQKELESMPPTDPVPFAKLIEALPDAPAGWTAEDARGSSSTMGEFKVSQASRRFTNGEKSVEVEIFDWNYKSSLYMPYFMAANFSTEDTEGYNKGIKLGDDPGREEYKYKELRGERTAIHKKRYLLKVSVNGMPKETLQDWWGKWKTAGLP
jgi:hypothetical protein